MRYGPSLPRLISVFRKEMTETFRDWKMLSMTLTFAPFFVLLMYAYLGHTTPVYQVAVVDLDEGAEAAGGLTFQGGEELLMALRAVRTPEGEEVLRVREAAPEEVEDLLESRRADVALTIPREFSQALAARILCRPHNGVVEVALLLVKSGSLGVKSSWRNSMLYPANSTVPANSWRMASRMASPSAPSGSSNPATRTRPQ